MGKKKNKGKLALPPPRQIYPGKEKRGGGSVIMAKLIDMEANKQVTWTLSHLTGVKVDHIFTLIMYLVFRSMFRSKET